MSDIDRPDWNYSAPTKGYEQPLPDSKALVPASPRALVAEMEAWTPETGVQVADLESEVSSLTDSELDTAGMLGEELLTMGDCPDPAAMEEALEDLSDGTLDLVARALLSYQTEPLDLLIKVEALANLNQTVELKRWFRRLPEELKDWIAGE